LTPQLSYHPQMGGGGGKNVMKLFGRSSTYLRLAREEISEIHYNIIIFLTLFLFLEPRKKT